MHPSANTLGDLGRGKSGKPKAARWCTDFSWASEGRQGNYVFIRTFVYVLINMQIVAAPSSFQFREGPHPPPGLPSRLHRAGRGLALDRTRLSRGACSARRALPRPGRPPPSPSLSAHREPSPAPGASPEPRLAAQLRPRRMPGAPPVRQESAGSAPPPTLAPAVGVWLAPRVTGMRAFAGQ